MTRSQSTGASQPSTMSVEHLKYSPAADEVSINSIRNNVVRKSNYKALGNGQFVKTGWMTRLRTLIEGNAADARYRRAAYEGTQRNSAAILSEEYRAEITGQPVDISDSKLVKNRFYRQDNLRFNPQFTKPEYGLNKRDSWSVRLSRWAHHANGVTELGAAPTGMLLKISKILITPNRDDKALGSQMRVFFALGAVAAVVGQFSASVFGTVGGKAIKETAVLFAKDLKMLFFSFSAVSAVSAFASLTFGAASVLTASKEKLSNALTTMVQAGKDKHIHRIYLLLDDVKDKPGAITLLAKAMRKKIGQEYRTDDRNPILLERLLDAVRSAPDEQAAKTQMRKTIGSYLTEDQADGSTPGKFLDLEVGKGELLKRENHFLALTNLVEHAAIESPASPRFKDLRHRIEAGAGHTRAGTMTGSSKLLNTLGFPGAGKSAAYLGTDDYNKQRDKDKANPAMASRMHTSGDYILANAHQFGPLTRNLARLSEGLRVVNHGILLSLNYQLTRPIAALTGKITESVFKNPNSRVTSFSIGRAVASSIWAVVDAFLLISLAGGNGVGMGGPEAASRVEFPLSVPMDKWVLNISIVSTAAQMLFVAAPAAVLMIAAKGALAMEGWKGNVSRPVEAANSSRKPVRWS